VKEKKPFSPTLGQSLVDDDGFPNSLEQGLRAVKFAKGRRLENRFPYRKSGLEPVVLRRVDRYIKVFDANGGELGVLRPTQRYVLDKGLSRVQWLSKQVNLFELRGYLKVRVASGGLLAILPPVIESVPDGEREIPERGEFLVCDGNHRIVQRCWLEEKPVCAVLAWNPAQPYYAYPFSAREWHITAENRLLTAPDLFSKYAPRRFPGDREVDSYRAYFRDFSIGFKNIGGQGGREL
jgi:hypothetical protein